MDYFKGGEKELQLYELPNIYFCGLHFILWRSAHPLNTVSWLLKDEADNKENIKHSTAV